MAIEVGDVVTVQTRTGNGARRNTSGQGVVTSITSAGWLNVAYETRGTLSTNPVFPEDRPRTIAKAGTPEANRLLQRLVATGTASTSKTRRFRETLAAVQGLARAVAAPAAPAARAASSPSSSGTGNS